MNKIKFLHCADIHLEAPFTSLGSGQQLGALRRQELKESFKRIITAAGDLKVDFLFISGDLYEHAYTEKGTLHFVNRLFGEIPLTEIVILPGNHDPYAVNSGYEAYQWNPNIHILQPSVPILNFDKKGVRIFYAGLQGNRETGRFLFNVPHDDFINVMLVHGTIDLNIGQGTFNPFSSNELAGCGMDYVAAGHFHNRLDDIGGRGVVYNPGSPEPLGFDEEGVHGYYSGTIIKENSGRSSLAIEFIKNCSRQYRNIEVYAEGCMTDEEVASLIHDAVSCLYPDRDLFSVTLKGYVDRNYRVDKQQVISLLKDRIFFIRLKDSTRPDYDLDSVSKEPGLKGLFARKVMQKIGQAQDEIEREKLFKALYLGLEALEGRME